MSSKPKRFDALVVDDDPEVRRSLSSALKAVGIRCDTAADGEHARQMMVTQSPDLLVTDLRMPIHHQSVPVANGHAQVSLPTSW